MALCHFKITRPDLSIKHLYSRSIGRRLTSENFRITSRSKLTLERIYKLQEAGFLGVGQEFHIHSQHDGQEAPAFHEEAPCHFTNDKYEDLGPNPSIPAMKIGFFVYDCESIIDSSD